MSEGKCVGTQHSAEHSARAVQGAYHWPSLPSHAPSLLMALRCHGPSSQSSLLLSLCPRVPASLALWSSPGRSAVLVHACSAYATAARALKNGAGGALEPCRPHAAKAHSPPPGATILLPGPWHYLVAPSSSSNFNTCALSQASCAAQESGLSGGGSPAPTHLPLLLVSS